MVSELDLKDKKILFELEQNSRQSLTQLAKKVKIKKETIFYRIKNLEKKGIIQKYLTEINIYKLGYQFYPILIKYQNTTPSIEEKIYSYLKKSKYVAWLTKCEGAWDLNLTIISKNNFELNNFLQDFLPKYSKYIADKHIFITTQIHYFKRGFWIGKPSTQTTITGEGEKSEINEKDYKLLKILSHQARKPLVEIAEKLNNTPKNISYKIKKLEKKGILQGSRILVDFTKIGYKFYKTWFSLKNVNSENFQELINYFKQHPNIIWATKTIGFYDLSIEMEVKQTEEFRKILNEIKGKFSKIIKKHESLLIFEEGVMNYFP